MGNAVDKVEIKAIAGKGGDGSVSFRRAKFQPWGGPDGGKGGKGGNVVIRSSEDVDNLGIPLGKRVLKAGAGAAGAGADKQGKSGEDLVVRVPVGTSVYEKVEDGWQFLADLVNDGQEVVVTEGGRGGWGNAHYARAWRQVPREAEKGELGEEKTIVLETKLSCDVAVVGRPGAGKSSLLAAVSSAHPRIADYPFTTQEPVLGAVRLGKKEFVIAEMPGLVEGASEGRGLGNGFLRHAERARVILHMLDGSRPQPLADWREVNREISLYGRGLPEKPQAIAVNKIDLPDVEQRISALKRSMARTGKKVYFVSAATGKGMQELLAALSELQEISEAAPPAEEVLPVLRPRPLRRD